LLEVISTNSGVREKPMQTRKTVVASLEGARVVVDENYYALEWYDFENACWILREKSEVRLSQERTESWVEHWNASDRFAALNLLIR